jgi:hypothetical protein
LYPHSSKGADVYVSIPSALSDGIQTDATGRLYNSAIHGSLSNLDDCFMKFQVNERLPERWKNSQIHATWVFTPSN